MIRMKLFVLLFRVIVFTFINLIVTAAGINNDVAALIRNANTTNTVTSTSFLNFAQRTNENNNSDIVNNVQQPVSCMCGVFLSGQLTKGKLSPQGEPVLLQEVDEQCICGPVGVKQCTNKCLDLIVRHLPNSQTIICASVEQDCFKERAYLYIKNCNNNWTSTNLSAGREYCCKDGLPYKCPKN